MRRMKILLLSLSVAVLAAPGLYAQTFGENVRVNDGAGGDQLLPSLSVSSDGSIYAVWEDSRNGDFDIYFAKSTDAGETWTDPNARVNDTWPADQKFPAMAIGPQGAIFVCWVETRNAPPLGYDIRFTRSTDGGSTWMTPNVRVDDGSPADQWSPSIAVDDSNIIYIVWEDTRNKDRDIYFARSADGGLTWSSPNLRVDDGSSGYQDSPCIGVDSQGNISVVWRDERNGYSDIYFAGSTDGGSTWTDPNVMANDPSFMATDWMDNPTLRVSCSGDIHVSFERWGEFINFTKSTDGGTSWLTPNVQVDDSFLGPVHNPVIAVDSSRVLYLAWTDVRSYLQDDIYFAQSRKGGLTWTDPNVKVNSDTLWNQRYPSLDVDDRGNIYVAWSDDRSGDYDIYFARGRSTGVQDAHEPRQRKREARLMQNWPNPFSRTTTILYHLPDARCHPSTSLGTGMPDARYTTLRIYDLSGRLVKTLVDELKEPGAYASTWDGRDEGGEPVPSGVYFYRLKQGNQTAAKKMVLLR